MKTTLALLTAALMMAPHLASANPGVGLPVCTPEKLAGTYGMSFTATALPGNSAGLPVGPIVGVGVLVLDSNGLMHGYETISFNGVLTSGITFSGTYKVGADCSFYLEDPGFFHSFGVAVSDGNELLVINTDEGVLLNGIGKRIHQQ